jgi:ribosomal protein S18 acetylase RimI-like enzyme
VGPEAELAGVWASPGYRRHGHARTVCAALLRRFFLDLGGELAWLSAGDEDSEALYRTLGFTRVGTQLNYALATGASP